MKNTLAIGAIMFGAMLVYSGYKNWTIGETIKFFSGQGAPDIDTGIKGKVGEGFLPPDVDKADPQNKGNIADGKDGPQAQPKAPTRAPSSQLGSKGL